MSAPMESLAAQFFSAVEQGDITAVAELYDEDVTVWHNYDDINQTKAENLATLSSIPERYERFAYDQPRVTVLPDGFLRQHIIVAERSGKVARVPAILRIYSDGKKVHRIEEYFDRGQLLTALSEH